MFDLTQPRTAEAGLPAYEVSNHARADAQSRHNFIYWRQGDYLGIGPGAHGRVTIDGARRATETHRSPTDYLAGVENTGSGVSLDEALSDADALTERLAMGLRTNEGVFLSPDEMAQLEGRMAPLLDDDLLRVSCSHVTTTPDGRRVLNGVLSALLT